MVVPCPLSFTVMIATFKWHIFWSDVQRPARILIVLVLALILRMLWHQVLIRMVKRIENGGSIISRFGQKNDERTGPGRPATPRQIQRAQTIASLLQSIGSFVIWSLALLTVLAEIGIQLAPLITGAGIAGVAFGFGAQWFVRDVLAGMFMLIEDQYGLGDHVDMVDATGTKISGVVEDLGLRTTQVRDQDGTLWYIPNGEIKRLGNRSATA